eukprot:scaffold1085_cov407-Prasinococcus_capsulatus_cf.AAC.90
MRAQVSHANQMVQDMQQRAELAEQKCQHESASRNLSEQREQQMTQRAEYAEGGLQECMQSQDLLQKRLQGLLASENAARERERALRVELEQKNNLIMQTRTTALELEQAMRRVAASHSDTSVSPVAGKAVQ